MIGAFEPMSNVDGGNSTPREDRLDAETPLPPDRPPPQPDFHPHYQCVTEGGCTHLQSKDGTSFCIHSAVLRSTSGYFRERLLIPQAADLGPQTRIKAVQVLECSEILEALLGIISGKNFDVSTIATITEIQAILRAAQKYEMDGVLSMIRYAALPPRSQFAGRPLQLALTSHQYGWLPEYRIALERTLSFNISAPDVYPELCCLDGTVVANIHKLHFLRIKRFKELLFSKADDLRDTPSDPNFDSNLISECMARRSSAFQRWKWMVVEEFTSYPSGYTLLKVEFSSSPEMKTLFGSYGCRHPNSRFHDLGLAQLSWTAMLRDVLDEVGSALSSDLDASLDTTYVAPKELNSNLKDASFGATLDPYVTLAPRNLKDAGLRGKKGGGLTTTPMVDGPMMPKVYYSLQG